MKPSGKIGALLSRNFDNFSGAAFVETLESVYLECRYPVPEPVYRRFPIPGKKNMYIDPVCSSGLPKFCYAVSIEVIGYIRDDFGIKVHQSFLERLRPKTTYRRFRNLFFGDQRQSLIERK